MTAYTDIENDEMPLVPDVTGPDERATSTRGDGGRPDPFEPALQEDAE